LSLLLSYFEQGSIRNSSASRLCHSYALMLRSFFLLHLTLSGIQFTLWSCTFCHLFQLQLYTFLRRKNLEG